MALDLTLAGNGKRSRGMLVPVKGLPIARLKVQEQGMMAVVRRTCSAMMTRGKYGVRSMRWTIMLEAGDVAAAAVLSCTCMAHDSWNHGECFVDGEQVASIRLSNISAGIRLLLIPKR